MSSLATLLLLSSVASAANIPEPPRLPTGPLGLSTDEQLDLEVDPELGYRIVVSDPVPIVPSPTLPPGLDLERSNNNLAIALHDGRLAVAEVTDTAE